MEQLYEPFWSKPKGAMATYGKTTIGGTSNSLAADTKRACKFTSPADINTVDSISVYANRTGTGTGYAVRGGVYTDNAGAPNALVANSSIEISANIARNAPAWYSINYVTKPALSPNTPYWLCAQAAKASLTYDDAGASNQQATLADTYGDDLANPFGASPAYTAREMSIYVSYTAGQTYPQALTAIAVGVAGLTKGATFLKSMAATAAGTASLVTALLFSQALAAAAAGIAVLAKVLVYVETLAATVIGVPVMSRVVSFGRTLAAVATGIPALGKKMFVSIAATAVGSAALLRKVSISLAATAAGQAILSTSRTVLQTVAATASGIATLATEVTVGAVATGQSLLSHLGHFASRCARFSR